MQVNTKTRSVLARTRAIAATVALVCVASFAGGAVSGREVQSSARTADAIWQVTSQRPVGLVARTNIVGPHAVVQFNKAEFDARMAPAGRDSDSASQGVVMSLPMPDGTFDRFVIKESPMLAPELAAAFPEIRTYSGQGVDDPSATLRFGWTSAGFHSILLSSESGTVYIDPYAPGVIDTYVAYRKNDYTQSDTAWTCQVAGGHTEALHRAAVDFPISHGSTMRTYRLALAANAEYTALAPATSTFAAGTKGAALARMVVTMNRVNGIYERDLAVRMTMATGTTEDPTALIFLDTATDGYTNDNGGTMLTENQTKLDAVIGTANYDLGHVFSTGGGGVAYLASPCNASQKGGGVTGSSSPTGDPFDVDYVAHEFGHQFGGNHTYNGAPPDSSSCLTRATTAAFEPASGVTIQAYAGICGSQNLQKNSVDRFHVESLNEMTVFLTSGGGSTCGVATATGNTPPTVTAGADVTIPARTPFRLTATGSDVNNDTLTYAWDQYDLGAVSTTPTEVNTDAGNRPLFRSYAASSSGTRAFPSETYILNNANVPPATYECTGLGTCLVGETMPTTSRTMNFLVTARDNRSGGGGIATGRQRVTTVETAGPFRMTSHNVSGFTATGGGLLAVTWDVAGTTGNGINAANVTLRLSVDGGLTFPHELIASTPNTGSATVTLNNLSTTQARIMVQAVDNVFFDINDANFTITGTGVGTVAVNPTALRFSGTKNGAAGAFTALTAPQTVSVTFAGAGAPLWTATVDQPWVQLSSSGGTGSSTGGTGAGSFTVGIINPGNVLGGSTSATANVTLTAGTTTNSPRTIPLTLTVDLTNGATVVAPFGQVDTPAQSATGVQGAIGVTGWVLDNVGVTGVKIYRNCLAFENQASCQTLLGASMVFIGDAAFLAGARPDVEAAFSTFPQNNRAGWGYLMLTSMLPHVTNSLGYGGQGPLTLYAIATDAEGNQKLLGRSSDPASPAFATPTGITMANDSIAKPFGAIDTPSQGQTVSGVLNNFGWALTPDSNTTADGTDILIPINGSTMTVFIDSLPVALVTYNQCRGSVGNPVPALTFCNDDVANIFGNTTPQPVLTSRSSNPTLFRNLDATRAVIGSYSFNTSTLSNGLHTIAWSVTDSANRTEGIGSRFFNVLNSGADEAALRAAPAQVRGQASSLSTYPSGGSGVWFRTGFDLMQSWNDLPIDEAGVRHIILAEADRVELWLGATVDKGYLVANDTLRDLPPGSSIRGPQFAWTPPIGYVGDYTLAFLRGAERIEVRISIAK
jgi:hypothetical protein